MTVASSTRLMIPIRRDLSLRVTTSVACNGMNSFLSLSSHDIFIRSHANDYNVPTSKKSVHHN